MSDNGASQSHLNGHSGFLLAVFVVVSAFVIWPIFIPIPKPVQKVALSIAKFVRIIGQEEYDRYQNANSSFPISLQTAPVIGVILLLATTTIHGSTIELGIKGDENVKPYDVLVLFISLAYISIALDGTGALEAIAFWVSKRGGSSGRLLFLYLYAFFLVAGCIVGNDPLILSGTPFLAYLTSHTGLDPTAWVFGEFMAANTASAVLVSSNPTNILITGSFSLNYITQFTKWTILPSIVPAILNYPILLFMFRKKIPKTITPLTEDPWSKLRNRRGAIFFSSLMAVTLAVLVGTTFVPGGAVEVWMVTAPAGVLAFFFDVFCDIRFKNSQEEIIRRESIDPAADHLHAEKDNIAEGSMVTGASTGLSTADTVSKQRESKGGQTDIGPSAPDCAPRQEPINSSSTTLSSLLRSLTHRFPGTTRTVKRLPIALLPFAMCEFILVRGLQQRGWITVFARGFANACTSPAATVFFFGFVCAAFLCPLAGTNIGATIILVEILRDPAFQNSDAVRANHRILLGAIYAVALGSNLGAFSYTFAGSLAGLLWRDLLGDKGVKISQAQFALVNLVPLIMQTGVGCAIILGQLYWFA
ncbi:hypothetical protein FKW77_003260 [Venturia effusa]|uniref:Citrate transporter-like domain-containing protein n=1 Tax=Venturia effusa TaxID=50376 RepID=A0A517LF60_9PEZI|nr:hypothetical protein FKW77_003260 [Venturia effusa]